MSSSKLSRSEIQEMLETAREHFREGNYRISESLLEQLVMADGKNPEIFHMLATIFYDQGKFNKAIRTFKRALEIDPSFTDASVGLSIILNDLGRYEEGKKVFVDAQQALKRKSTESDPYMLEKIASKHDELGEMYFQIKRYDESLEQYNRALSISSRKAELKMKVIECYIKKGENPRALKELRLVVQEFPHFTPARLKIGLMYYSAKDRIAAIEQWESVLLRDPDHPVALKYLQMAQNSGSSLQA
jgi:tetratricopeptide (TPR) repeat protein